MGFALLIDDLPFLETTAQARALNLIFGTKKKINITEKGIFYFYIRNHVKD